MDWTNISGINLIHGDCMDYMATMPAGCFELAIVDPPYGIGQDKGFGGFEGFGGFGKPIARRQYEGQWDHCRPNKCFFDELLRLCQNILIFGGNYFADILPRGNHWIVWDKLNSMPTFSDCELIWTNISRNSVKKITVEYNGLIGKEKEPRFHATQKPVSLYEILLTNYAKPGDTILDSHAGSFSSAIACHNLGFDYVGIEKDADYFEAGKKRVEMHQRQGRLF